MAVVTSSRKKVLNRVAIAAVLVIAIAFLSPICTGSAQRLSSHAALQRLFPRQFSSNRKSRRSSSCSPSVSS